jgi:hypothetical protein
MLLILKLTVGFINEKDVVFSRVILFLCNDFRAKMMYERENILDLHTDKIMEVYPYESYCRESEREREREREDRDIRC